jgi:uncharacterized membrane protein YecN with MAPEG domain
MQESVTVLISGLEDIALSHSVKVIMSRQQQVLWAEDGSVPLLADWSIDCVHMFSPSAILRVFLVAIKMHNDIEKQDCSIERLRTLLSPRTHL